MSKTISIKSKVGEKFSIELPINATGFAWKPREPYAPLKFLGEEPKPSGSMGGQGTSVFSFECAEQGTFSLSFVYKRPWESSPTDHSKHYSVTIE